MRLTKRGAELVRQGTFFNLKTWEFITIPQDGGYLPRQETESYLQVAKALVLVLGPMMGLAFVTILPLLGLLAIPVAMAKGIQIVAQWLAGTTPGAMAAGGGRRRRG